MSLPRRRGPVWASDRSIARVAALAPHEALACGALARAAAGADELEEDAALAAGSDAAARADEAVRSAVPTPSYNTRAIRRLSFLSLSVPAALKGCGYIMDISSVGRSRIGRITNLRVDELKALGFIARERMRRRAVAGGGDTEAEDAATEQAVCAAGFRAYVLECFGRLIPIPLADSVFPFLYHDAAICALTGVCATPGCLHIASAAADARSSAAAGERALAGGRDHLDEARQPPSPVAVAPPLSPHSPASALQHIPLLGAADGAALDALVAAVKRAGDADEAAQAQAQAQARALPAQPPDDGPAWSMALVYGELRPHATAALLRTAFGLCTSAPSPPLPLQPPLAVPPADGTAPTGPAPVPLLEGALTAGRVFIDLGSGEGWPVLLAALLLPLRLAAGVELVPRLHRRAEAHRRLLRDALAHRDSGPLSVGRVSFVQGSLTAPTPAWEEADVVFAAATAFDERLLFDIYQRAEAMRTGAVLVLTTQRCTSKLFELVHEATYAASWGDEAFLTARVYRRKPLGRWVAGILGRPRR